MIIATTNIDEDAGSHSYNFYVRDYLGSVRAVVGANGELWQFNDYHVTGIPSSQFGQLNADDHLHTSKEYNAFARSANNSPLFLTGLSYYDPIHVGSKNLYNGNISEMMWRQGANQLQSYTYSYDGMSRLTDTHHLSNLAIVDQNVEQNIRYDFNSNICSMTRINDGVNEYLSADYYGNQDINNSYDKRGNIVAINAKEVFMDYNLLNLPSQIKHYYEPEGSTTDYVYLTDGRKLTANFNGGEGLEYLGSFVYLRNEQGGLSLESTDFAAGRIENSTTGYKVNYHLTDHLSSVRAIATSTGAGTPPTITSRMDYQPFGTPHASSPLPTATQKHRYTFCGKEEQRIAPIIPAQYKLAVMDQGARYYIPNTMQFTSQDPLAIKYPHISPYVYCAANPIRYVDPDGRVVTAINTQAQSNIGNTLSDYERKFVKFDSKGMLDVKLLNKGENTSTNFTALVALANSTVNYSFMISKGPIGHEPFSEATSGVTSVPNGEQFSSPDNNVYIITKSSLSESQQIENTAHEAYGHAYFYELKQQGQNLNPFHDIKSKLIKDGWDNEFNIVNYVILRYDSNKKLADQIMKATKEANYNFKKRRK